MTKLTRFLHKHKVGLKLLSFLMCFVMVFCFCGIQEAVTVKALAITTTVILLILICLCSLGIGFCSTELSEVTIDEIQGTSWGLFASTIYDTMTASSQEELEEAAHYYEDLIGNQTVFDSAAVQINFTYQWWADFCSAVQINRINDLLPPVKANINGTSSGVGESGNLYNYLYDNTQFARQEYCYNLNFGITDSTYSGGITSTVVDEHYNFTHYGYDVLPSYSYSDVLNNYIDTYSGCSFIVMSNTSGFDVIFPVNPRINGPILCYDNYGSSYSGFTFRFNSTVSFYDIWTSSVCNYVYYNGQPLTYNSDEASYYVGELPLSYYVPEFKDKAQNDKSFMQWWLSYGGTYQVDHTYYNDESLTTTFPLGDAYVDDGASVNVPVDLSPATVGSMTTTQARATAQSGSGTGTGSGSVDLTLPEMSLPEILFKEKFPFCLPWDLYNVFANLVAEPEAPVFKFPFVFERLGIDYEFTIDLSQFDDLARVSRFFTSITFIVALISISRKMVGAE